MTSPTAAPRRFDGRVALVTGGGTGIGKGIACRLAAEGAAVAVASRNADHLEPTVDEIRQSGGTAESVVLDVRDAEAVGAAFDQIERRLGLVDVLVNNAAGNFVVPSTELTPGGWRAVLDIVATGSFLCSRELGQRLIAHNHPGSVLSVTATYAWTGHPGVVHSAAAKAAVLAMTRTLAVEWAPHGIRLNCIAPGPTETEGAGAALWPDDAARRRVTGSVPLGRFTTPEEVAGTAAFLLSTDAAYVTGDVVVVDGGQWLGGQVYGAPVGAVTP